MTKLIITQQVSGFHRWLDAKGTREYLRYPHRHLFTIRVEFKVNQLDRELEFHDMQFMLLEYIANTWPQAEPGHEVQFGQMSCEQIARAIMDELDVAPVAVEVWEDGENGARVEA